EQPTGVEPEPVRPGTWHWERVLELKALAVDDDDLGRLSDVGVHGVPVWVVDSPARPARQRKLGDHAHRVEVDDRGGAVLAQWFAEVEAVQEAPLAVVGDPIRVRADIRLPEEHLVRTAEDTDAGRVAVTREEQVVLLVDQDAGNAWQFGGKGAQ